MSEQNLTPNENQQATETQSTIFVKHEYNDKKPISKKKRTIKNIVSVGLSLVLIACLVVGITSWNKIFPPDTNDTGSVDALTFSIMSLDPNKVDNVHIVNEDNDYYIRANDDEENFWIIDGVDPSLTATEQIDTYIVNLCNLEVEALIEDGAEDLSLYGLDKPTRTATITLLDGSNPVTVKVGKTLPMSTGCYIMLDNGENKVFSTSNAVIQYYDHFKEDFAELSIYDAITQPDGDTYYFNNGAIAKYDYIKISGAMFPKAIELTINNGADGEFLPYLMTKPYRRPADNEVVTQMISYFVDALKADSLLCYDAGKIELEALGFDEPLAVFEVKAAGVTRKYTLGKELKNSGDYYTLMVDDRKQIYAVPKEDFAFLNSDITTLFADQIVMENIFSIKTLKIKDQSGSYLFDLVHDEKQGDGDDPVQYTKSVTMGGKELDVDKFKKLYSNVLLSNLQEFVTEATLGTPVMTVTYVHSDKKFTDTVVTLYDHSERRLLVAVNGTPIGYVINSNLDTIKSCLNDLIG